MANIDLTFHVQNQHVSRIDVIPVLSGSVNIYSAHFTFGSEWLGLIPYVQFSYMDDELKTVDCLLTEGRCPVPGAVYAKPGTFTVSCYGIQMEGGAAVKRITTEAASITVYTSSFSAEAALPAGDTNVYVRTGAYDLTSFGKSETGRPVPFILCTSDGILYYYDSVGEKYFPVCDAYRAAVNAGYSGTEEQFYSQISEVADSAASAQAAKITAELAAVAATASSDSAVAAEGTATNAAANAAQSAASAQILKEQIDVSAEGYITEMLNVRDSVQKSVGQAATQASLAHGYANEAAASAQSAADTLASKMDCVDQLRDMCSGKAYVSYTDVGPLPSHAGKPIETVFAPVCTEVGMAKFNNCTALKNLYLPAAEDVSGSFMNCTALTEVYLPSVKIVGANAFDGCSSLATLDLGANITTIGNYAFRNCAALSKLILRAPAVATLQNSGAMTGTKYIAGNPSAFIYVPDELVDTYKAATNWVYFQYAIKPLSELEE